MIDPCDAAMIADLRREALLREAATERLAGRAVSGSRPVGGRLMRLLRAIAACSWGVAPGAGAGSGARL